MAIARADATPLDAAADPLIARCLGGDREAWRELHRSYYPVALAFLRKLGVRDAEADDAAQEVFVQILRSLPGFEGRSAFKTWLYKLCMTQAERSRRRLRLGQRLAFWAQQEQDVVPVASGPEMSDAEARRRVQAALDGLKEHLRVVFVLFEMEGLSGREIATIVACPEATVWRRLHEARKAFAAAIDEGGAS